MIRSTGGRRGVSSTGYYRDYCYLPLYCFAGDVILWTQLRTSDRDASDGTVEALEQIVAALRERFPEVRIIVRGDSGFCREAIMGWCEGQREVYYCLGLARKSAPGADAGAGASGSAPEALPVRRRFEPCVY
jgi:hypothetical protein